MSEIRPVTPLLSEYIMGEAISEHQGVRCCPALHTETEEKYMVKIVSSPASRQQLEALLLSGAYASPEEARMYFRTLAEETAAEARALRKLSRLEGFQGYEDWQIEQSEDGTGYEVWLLSRYGTTLERTLRRECLTHLAAVNLGLDLCAALSVSRRNGWLYGNLKPENIFLSSRGYVIGDLGLLSMESLKYASLPEKYRSAYTAPEVADAYCAISPTLDIYAAGLVLYQVFNGGQLPQPGEAVAPPAYADGVMAGIILKAIAADPAERWQDPQEMGQALAAYLQSHSVNDTPIIPQPEPEETPDQIPEEGPEEIAEEISEEITEQSPGEMPEVLTEDSRPEAEQETGEGEIVEENTEEEPEPDGQVEAEPDEFPETGGDLEVDEEPEQFIIDGFLIDDTLQDPEAVAQLGDDVISDEVSEMLAQADALLAHKTPDPVVAPEPIEVPMPEPIAIAPEEPEPEPEEPEPEPEKTEIPMASEEPARPASEIRIHRHKKQRRQLRLGPVIAVLSCILVLLLMGLGGKYYYDNIYVQNVAAITLEGSEDRLTVMLDTAIDNSLLSVTCTDTYGNRQTRGVQNNQAVFTGLSSGTAYRIQVVISGRHLLTGDTSATYSTAPQTAIVGLTAVAGDTDGSVRLNFSVQGPDSEAGWLVKYSAPGTDELSAACSGHSVLIAGLEVGKTYNFRLEPMEELYLTGETEITFTAAAVVLPQDLTIRGFENGVLIADWGVADGLSADSWTVRCYNSDGYDMTCTVSEPCVAIEGLDISKGYTLDVRAEGMTVGSFVSISAGSVTFKELLIDHSDPAALVISWPYEGTAPEGGWMLNYSMDGGPVQSIQCDRNSCTLELPVPGASYRFAVTVPEGISAFGGTADYTVEPAPVHSDAASMHLGLFVLPLTDAMTPAELRPEDMTNTFTPGQKAGLLIRVEQPLQQLPESAMLTWILRSADGVLLQILGEDVHWSSLWAENACALELPELPQDLGEYSLELLLDGARLHTDPIRFTVAQPVEEEPTEPTDPVEE